MHEAGRWSGRWGTSWGTSGLLDNAGVSRDEGESCLSLVQSVEKFQEIHCVGTLKPLQIFTLITHVPESVRSALHLG